MWSKYLKTIAFIGTMQLLLWNVPIASGQQYTVPLYTINGGGGYAASGDLELEGTVGQPDAGSNMAGGAFAVTGGFWAGTPVQQDPIVIVADTLLVTRGTYVSGDLAELAESDNADLVVQRAATDIQSRTEFEVSSTSPIANPTMIEVALEGAVFARSTVNQVIELYDYSAQVWVEVDTRPASRFSDATATVAATGDLVRFVEPGTGSIAARIRYRSVNPRQQFSSNTDHFFWTIQ